ncbi:hypothetical protein [Aequorivita sediminis]|uniref:hypothetical protein n=1 Tax=Aequorivita sediminis TaxID=3073653 RepID=UPI0028AFA77C|nr:hypothetical protein [Aequorivita sp. F6058]
MKNPILTIIFILSSTLTFACNCFWDGNFIKTAKNAELVVLAKVVERNFHLENGKTFTTLEDAVNASFEEEYNHPPEFYESIDLEIISVIKGKNKRKIIRIFASNGADCRTGVRDFEISKVYLMTPNLSQYEEMPTEKYDHYFLGNCSETSIEYNPELKKVYGWIKGKKRKEKIYYDYNKLIRKIS